MTYNPDCWVILLLNSDFPHYRILASWYGGYTNGDSWKMSSGITKVVDHDNHYEIHNTSGSIYNCIKGAERMSSLAEGTYRYYSEQAKSMGDFEITVVDYSDIDWSLVK